MKLISFSKFAIFFLVIATYVSLSSSSFISDGVFKSQTLITRRNLLQTQKPCPEDFEHKDYTIITRRCKGPKFPREECCSSFKEFACPYADLLNDLSTDCAIVMFSYIHLIGKYPPGLFSSVCSDTCPEDFEIKDYTIITRRCKGPMFPREECCSAFKEFACPYVDLLNDLTTDCAIVMFSYIHLVGRYPPGLFANECSESNQGIPCP